MPQRNRVTPYGEIIVSPLRGAFMGNRGCIHREHEIVRPWNGKRWITCALSFNGWVAPKLAPGRWTALFFHDEAVAFAAGHRPCALCRRADYQRYRRAVGAAGADDIDARLHAERLDGRRKRVHAMPWPDLPSGTFVDFDGVPCVIVDDELRSWNAQSGYGATMRRPGSGTARVLTPPVSVLALKQGYGVRVT